MFEEPFGLKIAPFASWRQQFEQHFNFSWAMNTHLTATKKCQGSKLSTTYFPGWNLQNRLAINLWFGPNKSSIYKSHV